MLNLLSQVNTDDWVQLAVIALVVIGSVVANIVKSIVAKAKDHEQARARKTAPPFQGAPPPRQIRVEPPELSPQERMQAPPIAPPAPTVVLRPGTQSELERLRRRARERQGGQQFAPPPPVRVAPHVPAPAADLRRAAAEQERRAAEDARRAAAEQERVAAEEAARRSERRRRERAERERREAAKREAASQASGERPERLSMRHESLEHREARLAKQRAARLGHVDEGLVPSEPEQKEQAAPGEARVEAGVRRLPPFTPQSLRDAIVLSEILSPPLSIREWEVRSGNSDSRALSPSAATADPV